MICQHGNKKINSLTLADLRELINNNQLISGQGYKVEYSTKHAIPHTIDSNSGLPIVRSGTPETLIFYAISTNKLSTVVYSEDYPNDILRIDLDDTTCEDTATERDGRILYREDTRKNIICFYDWRNVKFRRYNRTGAEAAGSYTAWTEIFNCGGSEITIPDIEDYEDYFTFENSADPADTKNVFLGQIVSDAFPNFHYNNIVFKNGVERVYLGSGAKNNSFLATETTDIFALTGLFQENIIYGTSFKLSSFACADGFSRNLISGEFYSNSVHAYQFVDNNIGNHVFAGNSFLGSFGENTVNGYFAFNLIKGCFQNTFTSAFNSNSVTGTLWKCNFAGITESSHFHTFHNINSNVSIQRCGFLVMNSNIEVAYNITAVLQNKTIDRISPDGSWWYTVITNAGAETQTKVA